MNGQVLCNVRKVAQRVVDASPSYYSSDLLALIPEEILEYGLIDNNLYVAEEMLDEIRFRKETELLRMRGISADSEKHLPVSASKELRRIINQREETEALSVDQQQKVKEIKFLFNVAATVIHQ